MKDESIARHLPPDMRVSLFAYCEECKTLFLNAMGQSVGHLCGQPTGQVVVDSEGNKYIVEHERKLVQVPVQLCRRVVKLRSP